jgi:hypothetical protein
MTDNDRVLFRTVFAIFAVFALIYLAACAPRSIVADGRLDADRVAAVLHGVARARSLPLRRPLPVELVEKEFVRERYLTEATTYVSLPALDAYAILLRRMRLLPPDFDLVAYANDALGKNVGGFYDPKSGVMRLVHHTGKPWLIVDLANRFFQRDMGGEFLLAHELGHALADQYFDLGRFASPATQADQLAAQAAFIEGDAQLTAFAYVAGRPLRPAAFRADGRVLFEGPLDQWRSVPPVFRRPGVFLYLDGLRFAAAVYEHGGTRALNAVYARPPRSSEHILHPAKYLANVDPPRAVTFTADPPALGGFAVVNENTLGEMGVLTLLTVPLGWFGAAAAADGWGGDRFRIYRDPAHPARVGFAWKTVWDSPAEQVEFVENVRLALDRTFGPGMGDRWEADGTTFDLSAETGTGVLLVMRSER